MRLNDLLLLGLPMLDGEDKGGGGNTEKTAEELAAEAEEKEIAERKDLSESGKAALREERRLKRDAEKREADLRVERDALLQKERDREAADKKKREDDAAEAGKFQELAETREKERDDAVRERDALKDQNTKLHDAIAGVLDAEWKALPAEIKDVYAGEDDDPLAKLAFLPKARKLVERLNGTGERKEGNKPNPPPKSGENAEEDASLKGRNASRYRS